MRDGGITAIFVNTDVARFIREYAAELQTKNQHETRKHSKQVPHLDKSDQPNVASVNLGEQSWCLTPLTAGDDF